MTFQRVFICKESALVPWGDWVYTGNGIFVSAVIIDSNHIGLIYTPITTA